MKIFLSSLFVALALTGFAAPAPKTISLKVNPSNSKIEWFAKKVTGAHNGTVNVKSGNLDFKGNDLIAGKVEIDMTSITPTDIQGDWALKLAGHLKNDDFFAVDKFTTSVLNLKKAELVSPGNYKVTGDITIKGTTKEITFDAMVNKDSGTATADIKLDRTDFDIKFGSSKFFPEIGNKMVYDEFNLKVNLSFGKAL